MRPPTASTLLGPDISLVEERIEHGIRARSLLDVQERGQVVVHCTVKGDDLEHIRIWPSTFLICTRTGHQSRLIHAEGIVMPPHWMPMGRSGTTRFTLFFEGLPRSCVSFDLVERIDEQGAFSAHGILRNAMDVYRVGLD